ncbi:hypothetical protein T484DRAFT_1989302 [Baffinella frigidus]|nr:hypothetical protein T484DRAFT_1989302 [Cryptophyta sp. CCMP2293]
MWSLGVRFRFWGSVGFHRRRPHGGNIRGSGESTPTFLTGGGHPTPCTLHPAPCTLHPAPHTLHPSP